MIITEEEAKTKICQETLQPTAAMRANPNIHYSYEPMRCKASACMAWRWGQDTSGLNPSTTRGYCGKAGRP